MKRACVWLGILSTATLACAGAGVEDSTPINGVSGTGGANGTGGTNSLVLPDMLMIGTGGNGSNPDGCNDLQVNFAKAIPTVALLVDRSTSMSDEKYGTDTRWNVLKQAILDGQSGLIRSAQDEVRFGLVTYTSTAQSPTCPDLGSVDFKLQNFDAINTYYGPLATPGIKGETPTAEAIRETIRLLVAYKEEGPKFIVLATDGEPDTCPGTGSNSGPVHLRSSFPRDPNCGHDESVAAVQAAFAMGIRTFVVALGNFEPRGVDHLQALANAGQGAPAVLGQQGNWLQYSCLIRPGELKAKWSLAPGTIVPVYRPENAAILASDLKKVIGLVRGCSFKLRGKVEDGQQKSGIVALDDTVLNYGDPNGWTMIGTDEVRILGTACEKIQSDSKSLFISFPCGVYNPE